MNFGLDLNLLNRVVESVESIADSLQKISKTLTDLQFSYKQERRK